MRKTLKRNEKGEHSQGRILAAATLAISLAAFGCSTTDNGSTMSGQPGKSAPAAGTMGSTPASTPGSSSGTTGIPPQGMVSASSPDLDAIATLKADQAYGGRVLGPAAPGDNTQPSLSAQQTSSEPSWPSLTANPQSTVNSSISSAPTPAIVSGAGGEGAGLAVIAAPVSGFTAPAVNGAVNATTGTVIGTSTGVTGVSSTTATPTTNATLTNGATALQGNGMVTATNQATGSAIATPTFGTSPRLNVDNGIGVTGGVGNASVVPTVNGANATANGVVLNGTTTGTATSSPLTVGVTSGATTGGASGVVTLGGAAMATAGSVTLTDRPATASAVKPATTGARGNLVIDRSSTSRNRAVSAGSGTTSVPVKVITNANGSVTVTNVPPESRLRRAVRLIGIGRSRAVVRSTTSSGTATTDSGSTSGQAVDKQVVPEQKQP